MEEPQPSHSDTSDSMIGLSMSRSGGTSSSALKRGPPSSFEGLEDETSKKRFKEDLGNQPDSEKSVSRPDYEALAEDLAQELQCGCCAELVYRPVVVSPCQHFFCGRYDSSEYSCIAMLTSVKLLRFVDSCEFLVSS